MKRTDRLFQKSVAGKSRHIPAGYNRRIADTLNSLPDVAPRVSEETTVHVITNKRNYRYITAMAAATLIMITASAYLHYGITSGDSKKNNDPKTSVKVTNVTVTTSDQDAIVNEPSVTDKTTHTQSDKKVSESQKNSSIQNHDIAGDPEQINKNNSSASVTKANGEKVNGNAVVTENNKPDKVQNTNKPSDKAPSSPGYNPPVTNAPAQPAPVVTAAEPAPPDNGKDKGEKDNNGADKDKHPNKKEEMWGDIPFDRPDPAGKKPSEEKREPDGFIGGNGVGSNPAGLPGNMNKEEEKIQREIEKAQQEAQQAHEHPMPYMPCGPECEDQFEYPQD